MFDNTYFTPVFDSSSAASLRAEVCARHFGSMYGIERTDWSACRTTAGYLPELSLRLKGFGRIDGNVFFIESTPAGLVVLDANQRRVYIPIKPYQFVATTAEKTVYVGYTSGGGFCKSEGEGFVRPAKGLFFAELNAADRVYREGGRLAVRNVPKRGDMPVYLFDEPSWRNVSTTLRHFF